MDLSRKLRWRSVFSRGMDILIGLVTLTALIPLVSVLYMVVSRGAGNFRWSMLWELPPAAGGSCQSMDQRKLPPPRATTI